MYHQNQGLFENNLSVSIKAFMQYKSKLQVFAICSENNLDEDSAFENFVNVSNHLKNQINLNRDFATLCTGSYDLKNIKNKLGVIICAESALPIGNDLDKLRQLYKMGLRVLCPAWEGVNKVCGSFDTDVGFTSFGKQVIRECEKLGIVIDVSHLSKKAFFELSDFAQKPFIASHSCSASVYPHERNLTAVQINTIMRNGGISGLSLVKKHLCAALEHTNSKKLALEMLFKHIVSFINECNDCRLALGLDLDGTEPITELDNALYAKDIYDFLLHNGINENKLCEIFYNNAFNYFSNMI